MTIFTVTARGRVTLRREAPRHLRVRPGEKLELDMLPHGRVVLKAARPTGSIDAFLGSLAGKSSKVATIEEINAAQALYRAHVTADQSSDAFLEARRVEAARDRDDDDNA
jgi:bifunctional DNA-binding transcriptional regulator/antitoxin component of YhaV-PrlF toxin-antitoxin module